MKKFDIKKAVRNLSNDLYLLQLSWKYVPGYIVWEIIYGIVMGIWKSSGVIFTKFFYDALSEGNSLGKASMIVFGMIAYWGAFQAWYQWYRNVYRLSRQQTLHYEMNRMLFEAAQKLDLSCYDDPEYYNDFIWAMSQSDSQAVTLIESISNVFTTILALTITTTVIASVSPILAVIAVLSAVTSIALKRLSIKLGLERNLALNPVQRKSGYYERIFNTPDYAKEVRISQVSDIILEKYDENLKNVRKLSEEYNIKGLKFNLPSNILSSTMQPIVYIILLYQIMVRKAVSIAGLAVAFQGFWRLKGMLQTLIDLFIRFPEHGMYIEKVRTFLEYQPQVRSGRLEVQKFESVTFRNVSFGYNAEHTVLKNLNFTLNRGEKIAIVGYNGAGKSTFIKLLMHLYDPTEGEIFFNGRDIGEYDTKSYQDRIGAVFQDFQIFALPLCENVLCDIYRDEDEDTVKNAIDAATLLERVETFPNGIHTELTKEFYDEGVNLSGGEAQKVAIARVFAHPYDLIIMDEPSSALDPIAEYELNRHIKEFSEDKTVIFISHRLSTTRHVDRIYMFEDGRIIESGSHNELMALDGKYAEMFSLQAENYNK